MRTVKYSFRKKNVTSISFKIIKKLNWTNHTACGIKFETHLAEEQAIVSYEFEHC